MSSDASQDEALVAKRKMEEERNADRVAALGVSKKSKRSSKKVSRRRKAPVEVEEEEEEIEEDEE